jgi:hypothetical protein
MRQLVARGQGIDNSLSLEIIAPGLGILNIASVEVIAANESVVHDMAIGNRFYKG